MKTRQTKRKQSNVPGRYLAGSGEPQDVVLRDVSVGGCRFEMGRREGPETDPGMGRLERDLFGSA